MVTEKTVWYLFYANIIAAILVFILGFNGISTGVYKYILPIIFIFAHAYANLKARAFLFFASGALIGFLFEYVGVHTANVFGSYAYTTYLGAQFFGVPILVIIFWPIFIYTGYAITNASFAHLPAPAKTLSDVVTVVAADFFMDPIMHNKAWVWAQGAFFGVPLSNFVGWAVVTGIVSALWRYYDVKFPQPKGHVAERIPLMGYSCVAIVFALYCVINQQFFLALVGTAIMFLVIEVHYKKM